MEDNKIRIILTTNTQDVYLYKVQYKNTFLGTLTIIRENNNFKYVFVDNHKGHIYTYNSLNEIYNLLKAHIFDLLEDTISIETDDRFLNSIEEKVLIDGR